MIKFGQMTIEQLYEFSEVREKRLKLLGITKDKNGKLNLRHYKREKGLFRI
jgi:hypothetical protein